MDLGEGLDVIGSSLLNVLAIRGGKGPETAIPAGEVGGDVGQYSEVEAGGLGESGEVAISPDPHEIGGKLIAIESLSVFEEVRGAPLVTLELLRLCASDLSQVFSAAAEQLGAQGTTREIQGCEVLGGTQCEGEGTVGGKP